MFVAEPASTPALRVVGLRKTYAGGRGVHDVSFEAPAGSLTAFIGANGAGKSTTIRSIVGILSPDAGSIELFGRRAFEGARRRIGFLPEERGLNPLDRARDSIAFAARLKGVSRGEAFARADELLGGIGLGERRRARIAELSKGNAQRVQILTAFVHRPDLLILDEPFSGLDPEAQGELRAMLLKFRERGGSVLFSTHALPSAEKFCDRVVILANGRTLFEGPIDQALAKAPHGAVVRTDDPTVRLIAHMLGGEAVPSACEDGGPTRWRVSLPAHVPYTALMWKLSEAGVEASDLQPIKADLETAYAEIARTRAA